MSAACGRAWAGTDIYRAEEALFIARMTEKSLEGLDKKVI
jgi:hypothetical protein